MNEEQQLKLIQLHDEMNKTIQSAYQYLDQHKFQQSATMFSSLSAKSSEMYELVKLIDESVKNNNITENVIEEKLDEIDV